MNHFSSFHFFPTRTWCALCVALAVTGTAAAQTSVTISTIKGPSGIGLIRLFDQPVKAPGVTVHVEALADASLVMARLASGAAQVGVLPPNVAAKLAASGQPVQVAAVLGTGMLSLLSADPSIKSINDLKGKTVDVAGQASTPDYVFRRILQTHGLNPDKDVRLNYAMSTPEITKALIAGKIKAALLPEPFATMARNSNGNLKPVIDIQAEWIKAGGAPDYPMTVLVVDKRFAAANPKAVQAILNACADSIKWVVAHPADAGILAEKYHMGVAALVVRAAVPRSNYVFIPAAKARPSLEALYRVFLAYAPASIGAMPGDSFYYK